MSDLTERLRDAIITNVTGSESYHGEYPALDGVSEAVAEAMTEVVTPLLDRIDFQAEVIDSQGRRIEGLERQVEAEISDMVMVAGEVSKVYDELTRGRISKPNTVASAVISEHDETCYFKEERDEARAKVEHLTTKVARLREALERALDIALDQTIRCGLARTLMAEACKDVLWPDTEETTDGE